MSIKLMTKVWETCLPPTQKMVLLALADNANDEGVCWPSMKVLQKKTSLTDRAIQKSLNALEAAGFVKRNFNPSERNTYILNLEAKVAVHPEPRSSRTTFTPSDVRPHPERNSPPPRTSYGVTPNVIRGNPVPGSGLIYNDITINKPSVNHQLTITKPPPEIVAEDHRQESFNLFWASYPSNGRPKGSKYKARQTFEKALHKTSFNQIMEGLQRYVQFIRSNGQLNADGCTWLAQERWADDYKSQPIIAPIQHGHGSDRTGGGRLAGIARAEAKWAELHRDEPYEPCQEDYQTSQYPALSQQSG